MCDDDAGATVRAVAQVWGLPRLAATVVVMAALVVVLGDEDTWQVPLISLPVDVLAIAAALSGALLSGVLTDRCADLSLSSPRRLVAHDLVRYAALVAGALAVPLLVGVTTAPDAGTVSAFVWLAGLAACVAPVAGELVWAPALLAGYAWLQVHTDHPELLGWMDGRTTVLSVLLAGAIYAIGSALRRRRARRDGLARATSGQGVLAREHQPEARAGPGADQAE
ncbi:hypothetical protein ISU10_12120 [Nocardioides agariphilus]|uniref:Uncharacterized protein n=1 Tax=Nocardioides agariphilus TaxID=433664 RepID=A0A930VMV5_9ACTN|nr:hypothetical protein [Nocardioides agariphilus]MBF4768511.1 hypothetical protein [Nocardioides agariphilus]